MILAKKSAAPAAADAQGATTLSGRESAADEWVEVHFAASAPDEAILELNLLVPTGAVVDERLVRSLNNGLHTAAAGEVLKRCAMSSDGFDVLRTIAWFDGGAWPRTSGGADAFVCARAALCATARRTGVNDAAGVRGEGAYTAFTPA